MCTQNGAGGSQSDSPADTNELIAALESVLAALDAAGEKMAAIHVSMALDALLGRSA